MDRDPQEQGKSQRKFLSAQLGIPLDVESWPANDSIFQKILEDTQTCIDLLSSYQGSLIRVKFEDLLADPAVEAKRVSGFCGGLNEARMAQQVLVRNPKCLPYMLELK